MMRGLRLNEFHLLISREGPGNEGMAVEECDIGSAGDVGQTE